ncbi:SDR family oxidoreductase [Alicyclobacillus fodiniaquatilis]|uniref:SDR family oxidoreductase n=1 Tax=Alicyclobacillus fodiniaquatilis TaxID=1661150 RepID=A0ABW4JNL1_9BACL
MGHRRVAIVTGSASGLGVQTVLGLAGQGYDIVINYRKNGERAAELKAQVEALGVRCLTVQADISQEEGCQRLVAETRSAFASIDILVNNAGPYIFEHKKMTEYTSDEWHQMLNGNLSSVFYLCKEIIPMMRRQHWGRIITFGFTQSNQAAGWPGRSAYAAAKVGVVSLTRTLAQEEADAGITVNMICPGDITGEHKEMTIAAAEAAVQNAQGAQRRFGVGEDIARVVRFLCTPEADFITGAIVDVNGGLTLEQIVT